MSVRALNGSKSQSLQRLSKIEVSFFEANTKMKRVFSIPSVFAAGLLVACGGPKMDAAEMTSSQPMPMQTASLAVVAAVQDEYRIGVGDKINLRVFQVPDLSVDDLVIDTSGNVQMPLIGLVRGAGRTPGEMAEDISSRLSDRFLRDPHVTVTVTEAASQKITIDGAVMQPGVYEIRGSISLLQAVAMARGPTGVADLSKVAVFRTVDGQRSVALFDLGAIRQGQAEDPQVLGGDVVVVDISRLNSALRGILSVIPAFSIFRTF